MSSPFEQILEQTAKTEKVYVGSRNIEEVKKTVKRTKTFCPQCGSPKATIRKTRLFMILECRDCGFEMGTPREKKA